MEKARLEARRELQELRRQVKQLDGERNKMGQQVNELQRRVAKDEEKEEEARKENFGLKQKVKKFMLFVCGTHGFSKERASNDMLLQPSHNNVTILDWRHFSLNFGDEMTLVLSFWSDSC